MKHPLNWFFFQKKKKKETILITIKWLSVPGTFCHISMLCKRLHVNSFIKILCKERSSNSLKQSACQLLQKACDLLWSQMKKEKKWQQQQLRGLGKPHTPFCFCSFYIVKRSPVVPDINDTSRSHPLMGQMHRRSRKKIRIHLSTFWIRSQIQMPNQ